MPHPSGPLRYGAASDRREAVLRRVLSDGYASLSALAAELDVSERTVRRDLVDLGTAGAVALVPGGATAPPGTVARAPFAARAVTEAAAKRAIARLARTLVSPGDSVALDAGSTISFLAAELLPLSPLTVITSSLEVIGRFSSDAHASLIGVGGQFDPDRRAFVGPVTRATLEDMRATTAFVACSGVHATGIACDSQADAEVKRALLGMAGRRVLVATSSVFRRVAPVRMAEFTGIDTLVTDDGLDPEPRDRLADAGVQVLLAPLGVAPSRGGPGD